MPKFFVEKNLIKENSAQVIGQDAKHIAKVLRHSPGDEITICDGSGTDYKTEITAISENQIELKILSKSPCLAESDVKVTLFQCLPKSHKMDFIIEKATELGASFIVPVVSERCVVKIEDEKKEEKKLLKWQMAADEAAKQCGRGIIPTVKKVKKLEKALDGEEFDLLLVCYELEDAVTLKEVMKENLTAKKVGIFIGAEGGFSKAEHKFLVKQGAKSVSLGKRILRTETAGITVISAVMYELADFK